MEVFVFHLASYLDLPADFDGNAWVTCSNELYDPHRGGQLMNIFLDQLEYAEELGFDGVCVNEHHQTPYAVSPSPNLFAASLARRTSKVRICVIGDALPLYSPPLRVAEEMAVLDGLSGGRIDAGMVVGAQPEYFTFAINPTEARGRFAEALELIVRSWTERGPFAHNGRYFQLPYVNPWPRPIQQPHPPVWIPGAGSIETMNLCANKKYAYSGIPFFDKKVVNQNYALFRKTWNKAGNEPDPSKLAMTQLIYIADTNEQARREFEEHYWYFSKKLLEGIAMPVPGYMSAQSSLRMMAALGDSASATTWEEVERQGLAMIGTAESIADQLCERIATLGAGRLNGQFHIGNMPDAMVRNNMAAFAEHVMPAIRKEFPAGPQWTDN